MPDARTPSKTATGAAENLLVIIANTTPLLLSREQVKRLIADEVQRAIDSAEPASDPRQAPLLNCLTEIVSVLCYQPSVPQEHKSDMANALNELKAACGIPMAAAQKRILE